ncbi:hypothetical protein HNV11_11885 [Spirosoma taeanense]|uniref:Periplasmic heavy metal sensor n=1 Tax=Spirosoma taeanense TaxID=2735870 RepID=A0A6M5Y7Y9_9BACT|nr:hypothetical protein [Spirosoma taeanense]QJW90025.1 hypothetical protein HNV11_11885 [Spirosoma taeanense]
MNTTKAVLSLLSLSAGLLLSLQSFGQYYPGYSGGGMGRGMGMGSQNMGSSSRPIPNIAGDMANKETKWLKENLSLDKEQAKAVKKLNNEYADQQQDALKDILRGGAQPTPETRKQVQEMMLMLNEEKEDKLKTLLTPDQWTLYQSKKEDMQKAIGGFRPPAKPTATAPRATTL